MMKLEEYTFRVGEVSRVSSNPKGKTKLNVLADGTRTHDVLDVSKFMFPDGLAPDYALHIHRNSHPLSITFNIFKFPSETLG